MTIKAGNWYKGKISGEFFLIRIKNVNGKAIFNIRTVNHEEEGINLSLEEMKEEKPKAA